MKKSYYLPSFLLFFLSFNNLRAYQTPPSNDDRVNAQELVLDSLGNLETANNAYSLVDATPDGNTPPNWSYGLSHNVWFKVKPTNPTMNLIIRGGLFNDMIAVYDESDSLLVSKTGPYSGHLGLLLLDMDTTQYYTLNVDARNVSTFGFKITSEVGFDYRDYAEELVLDSLGNLETANNAYSLVDATPDGNTPPNWSYGLSHNVWFKVKPTNPTMNLIIRGGLFNDMIAVYDESDSLLVSKTGPYSGHLGLLLLDMDTTQYYTLNVDARNVSTFGFKITSEVGFDYRDYAQELVLDSLGNLETANNAYSLVDATPDGNTPPNWSYGLNHNVWFKVKPTNPTMKVVMKGSIYNKMLSIEDSLGNVVRSDTGPYTGDLVVILDNLIQGAYYWLNVDGRFVNNFGLEISPTPGCGATLWAIADGDWDDPNTWSDTEGGGTVFATPCETTNVYIKGFNVVFNSSEPMTAKYIELIGIGNENGTSLDVQSGILRAIEKVKLSGVGVGIKTTTSSSVQVGATGG
ncbi:hypothetical protein [Roseivirga sp.]|uniref:hypothetical protein n=1 Tax=Roseivirga sp. TaxID=1964215 RepID=UPI003B520EDA